MRKKNEAVLRVTFKFPISLLLHLKKKIGAIILYSPFLQSLKPEGSSLHNPVLLEGQRVVKVLKTKQGYTILTNRKVH